MRSLLRVVVVSVTLVSGTSLALAAPAAAQGMPGIPGDEGQTMARGMAGSGMMGQGMMGQGMSGGAPMGQNWHEMQKRMERIRDSKDPEAQQKLMSEQMQDMQQMMHMMRGQRMMMGPGMMGPGMMGGGAGMGLPMSGMYANCPQRQMMGDALMYRGMMGAQMQNWMSEMNQRMHTLEHMVKEMAGATDK